MKLRPYVDLAAPQTWAAGSAPAVFAYALAAHDLRAGLAAAGYGLAVTPSGIPLPDPVAFLLCLVGVILLQSCVNALNDIEDFERGTDTESTTEGAHDAVLVYGSLDVRRARAFAYGCLVLGIVCGAAVCLRIGNGWPLLPALVGTLVLGAYSLPKKSISQLPLGEFASGVTMGWLVPVAVYFCLAGQVGPRVMLAFVPTALLVGFMMFTNNLCDKEGDEAAGRRTLAHFVPRDRAAAAWRTWALVSVAVALVCYVAVLGAPLVTLAFFVLVCPVVYKLFMLKPVMAARPAAMGLTSELLTVVGLVCCVGAVLA